MIPKMLTVFFELCLALAVSASVIKSYQDFSMQVCPMNAVCSEIHRIPSQGMTSSYLNNMLCKCTSGLYCPTEPGPQTLSVDNNRWYGMCQSVEELPRCQRGEVAEEIRVNARDFGGQTYTKMECTCPRHDENGLSEEGAATMWADTTSESSDAKTIYHLMCSEDFMSKRGRYGSNKNKGRFYFYKK